ncbi:hypothetical protein Nans01_18380 [Nocardiopsis ansamitocini]|uniref:Uncharacterized protein n=1 Tax=Nocardiopsis ansamitocini TaxID=1670832 RepID=A0A9W6P5K4_9ACTN|nr:hypothetical protein Nans01_18380 [Nocardiopsis ansamitocini]
MRDRHTDCLERAQCLADHRAADLMALRQRGFRGQFRTDGKLAFLDCRAEVGQDRLDRSRAENRLR